MISNIFIFFFYNNNTLLPVLIMKDKCSNKLKELQQLKKTLTSLYRFIFYFLKVLNFIKVKLKLNM